MIQPRATPGPSGSTRTWRCSVETLAGGGEEHDVVGQHAEVAFALPAVVGSAIQGTTEPPLVPGEGRFRLPALAVHTAAAAALRLLPESADRLPPGPRLGPLAAPP